LALSFREQLTRFYHKESSSPHPAIEPIEGAVLFELVNAGNTQMEGGVSETVIDSYMAEEDLSNHVASIS
jgi:hypothetical protein